MGGDGALWLQPAILPLPAGDLSRLGNGERNLAEPKVAWRPSERARASQRRGEGELFERESHPICDRDIRGGAALLRSRFPVAIF
jgi:hypothetical protein